MIIKSLCLMMVAALVAGNAHGSAEAPASTPETERVFDKIADVSRGDRVQLRGEVVRMTAIAQQLIRLP